MVQGLLQWLNVNHDVEIVDTTEWNERRLASFVRRVPKIWVGLRWADVATYHPGGGGFVYLAPILVVLCRVLRTPLVIHSSGGTKARSYREGGLLQRTLIRLTLHADALLFETKGQAEFYRGLVDVDKVHWFPNNREYRAARAREELSPPGGSVRAVFVGHVKLSKGVGLICEAVESLQNGIVAVDVFGPILEDGLEERMEWTDGVEYRGILDPKSVVDIIAQYHVLLLPTTHYGEGYPGVLLEAFAAGTPVITTRWKAIPEIVEDGVNGLLVPTNDSRALAGAIRRLSRDERLYERLVTGALNVREQFGRDKWGATLESILKAAVETSFARD